MQILFVGRIHSKPSKLRPLPLLKPLLLKLPLLKLPPGPQQIEQIKRKELELHANPNPNPPPNLHR
ncbi:MAG: hypothetical protein IKH52_06470 [Bacteroidaceae bacterium]|nr:hypothetical protein [Bacteroidaceae bacterium]